VSDKFYEVPQNFAVFRRVPYTSPKVLQDFVINSYKLLYTSHLSLTLRTTE
jgi:hypothetical protein